jgi:hypothetical protein
MVSPRHCGDAPAYYSSEQWFEDWKLIQAAKRASGFDPQKLPAEFAGFDLPALVADHELELSDIDAVGTQLNGF